MGRFFFNQSAVGTFKLKGKQRDNMHKGQRSGYSKKKLHFWIECNFLEFREQHFPNVS